MTARQRKIDYSRKFEKHFDRAPLNVKRQFVNRRKLFEIDPYHPRLHNHKLSGKYTGCRSINITGDWRAVYRRIGSTLLFIDIGTHSQLYE